MRLSLVRTDQIAIDEAGAAVHVGQTVLVRRKAKTELGKLIAGPGVYVCNECVDLCNEILVEETPAR